MWHGLFYFRLIALHVTHIYPAFIACILLSSSYVPVGYCIYVMVCSTFRLIALHVTHIYPAFIACIVLSSSYVPVGCRAG
jgi:hypothetical protein